MLWSLVLGLDRRLLTDGAALIVARLSATIYGGPLLWASLWRALALETSAGTVGEAYSSSRGGGERISTALLLLEVTLEVQRNESE